jgi:hypothetical protein
VPQTRRDYSPTEVLRRPLFWVMYAMFVMVAAGGLMATAQLASIAQDFKIMARLRLVTGADGRQPVRIGR